MSAWKCCAWKASYIKVKNKNRPCPSGQGRPCLNSAAVKSQHISGPVHVMWREKRTQRNAISVRVSPRITAAALRSFRRASPVMQSAICGVKEQAMHAPWGDYKSLLLILTVIREILIEQESLREITWHTFIQTDVTIWSEGRKLFIKYVSPLKFWAKKMTCYKDFCTIKAAARAKQCNSITYREQEGFFYWWKSASTDLFFSQLHSQCSIRWVCVYLYL